MNAKRPSKTDKVLGELRQAEGFGAAKALDHMGCLVGCADYLGLDCSPAWLFGISGYAFVIHVHEALCPSGPYAWPMEVCDSLAADAGLVVQRMEAGRWDPDIEKQRKRIWDSVCAAIDDGTPCVGWDLDDTLWSLICGYDSHGNYLALKQTGDIHRLHHGCLGETEIGVVCIMTVERGSPTDDVGAVERALFFAVNHDHFKFDDDNRYAGLAAYDAWIAALRDPQGKELGSEAGIGQALYSACWSECRKQAVAFLHEAKLRIGGSETDPLFDEAIGCYGIVSERLQAVARAFPFGGDMNGRLLNPALRTTAIEDLLAARTSEQLGLELLQQLLTVDQGIVPPPNGIG